MNVKVGILFTFATAVISIHADDFTLLLCTQGGRKVCPPPRIFHEDKYDQCMKGPKSKWFVPYKDVSGCCDKACIE